MSTSVAPSGVVSLPGYARSGRPTVRSGGVADRAGRAGGSHQCRGCLRSGWYDGGGAADVGPTRGPAAFDEAALITRAPAGLVPLLEAVVEGTRAAGAVPGLPPGAIALLLVHDVTRVTEDERARDPERERGHGNGDGRDPPRPPALASPLEVGGRRQELHLRRWDLHRRRRRLWSLGQHLDGGVRHQGERTPVRHAPVTPALGRHA